MWAGLYLGWLAFAIAARTSMAATNFSLLAQRRANVSVGREGELGITPLACNVHIAEMESLPFASSLVVVDDQSLIDVL